MLSAMAIVSSLLLVLSLWFAVLLGPQMRAWSWGPALVALAGALACSAVVLARGRRTVVDPATLALGVLTAGWFAWRAWLSPVAELAHADLLLLAGAVGSFVVARAMAGDRRAEAVFLWGCGLLLAGHAAMVFAQVANPDVSQFHTRPGIFPSGFYGHYNEGANFLIGAAFLLVGAALFGRHRTASRIAFLLVAVAGLAAVYFTRSRGALLGVVVACGVLGVLVLFVGSRRKAEWFAPAAIGFPLLALAAGVLLYVGWDKTEEFRTDGTRGVSEMMDNPSRLRNLSLAIDTITLHPLTGGGSRSFSWESVQAWDSQEHGVGSTLPEQVHNEILQAATDYGLLGAGLLLALLLWLSMRAIWWSHFEPGGKPARGDPERPEHGVAGDALRVGAAAALAGMLVQSSFSFVFHLLPGALLLGIALGRLAVPASGSTTLARTGKFALAGVAAMVALAIAWPGVAGTRVLAALLPVYFRAGPLPEDEDKLDRFSTALDLWPQSELHHSRAAIHHSASIDGDGVIDPERLRLALADYQAAAESHPMFPAHRVNAANILSLLGEDADAEALYREAVALQGNMERAFQAHFHESEHFRRKGVQHYREGDVAASLRAMENAASSIEAGVSKSAWLLPETWRFRVVVHENLGAAREAARDREGALEAYDFASGLRFGEQAHYRAGLLQMRWAEAEWHERRPEAALPRFIEARRRLMQARRHLPPGETVETFQEYIDYIDGTIAFLRGAGFEVPK